MNKNYLKVLAIAFGILSWSGTTSAQTNLLDEDFSSASGSTPPAGWANNEIDPSGVVWTFDNPGGLININSPIEAPFADLYSGSRGSIGTPENTALESKVFDASGITGSIFLSFDQFFNLGLGGEYYVEVFNGTTWVEVLSDISNAYTSEPDHQFIDVTTAINYASDAQVRFRWVGNQSYYWVIDNVVVEAYSCASVANLNVTGTTINSADFDWTAAGTEGDWNIECGTPGFEPGTSSEEVAGSSTTESYTVNGLSAATQYDVYIQSNCGGGELSPWAGPFTFTTSCGLASLPYSEDFESAETPNMPLCTSEENIGAGNDWITEDVNFGDFNSRVLLYGYDETESANAWFYTQGIHMIGGTSYLISYDYGDSEYEEKLKIAYGTNPNSTSMVGNTLADHITGSNGELESNTIVFTPTSTGDYYFGFNVYSDANAARLYVDNILIDVAPTCPEVTDLELTGTTTTSADIAWTIGGSESAWNIEWGATGFVPGTNDEIGTATASSASTSINGLSQSTSYDVYVQADCNGDLATWTGPLTITTDCGVASLPYALDFESVTPPDLPLCTINENVGVGNDWESSFVDNVLVTGQVLNYYTNFADPADTWFYTQGISLTAGTYYKISYKYGSLGSFEDLKVAYGQDQQSTSMTEVLADHNISNATQTDLYSNVVTFTPATDGVYYFGFNAYSGTNGFRLFVDDILIEEASSCPEVAGITLDDVTSTTADVSWTAGSTESSWNFEVGTTGFTPGAGTEIDAATVGSSSYSITGLSQNTTYDVYVQADCGSDQSSWFGPFEFTTDCGAANIPYELDFESATVPNLPACTSSENVGAGNNWQINESFSPFNNNSLTYGYSANPADAWFYTQGVNLTAGTYYEISYEYSGLGSFTEDFAVAYGSSPNSSSMTESIESSNITVGSSTIESNAIIFTPPSDGVYYFGFNAQSDANQNYLFVDNILIDLADDCPYISGLTVINESETTIGIGWTAGSTESSWNIEWGAGGFTPGTGNEIGAATSSITSYAINGLTPSTDYDIYVQADCGSESSTWKLVQGSTDCGIISTFPWTENFDGMSTSSLGANVFPSCWSADNGEWYSADNSAIHGESYSAPNHVAINYSSSDYLWTPEFELTAGTTYEFSFRWLGDDYSGWDGSVFTSPDQSSSTATQIGDKFVQNTDITSSTDYKKEVYCFTPSTSGTFSFGIFVNSNSVPWTLSFDNFKVQTSTPVNAGTDGTIDVCQTGGLVNLNTVITMDDTDGVWLFDENPSAIQNDSLFDPANASLGTNEVYYTLGDGCYSDTATATIEIVAELSAGIDGSEMICNNVWFDLYEGLGGNQDYNGQWYDATNQPLATSVVDFSEKPLGTYNYTYVVDNGVCPADTSLLEIQLQDCVGLDEYELKGFALYPNPTSESINIEYSGKGEDVKLEVLDAIGKTIWVKQVQFNDGTIQKIDLNGVESGLYYINLTSKKGSSIMKVVKN